MKNEQARPQHFFLRLQAVQKFYDPDPLFNFHLSTNNDSSQNNQSAWRVLNALTVWCKRQPWNCFPSHLNETAPNPFSINERDPLNRFRI